MISNAFAQEAATAAAQQPGLVANLIPLILIIVVFYFFMIRPQQKRLREHQEMVSSLRRGDKIVTAGGLIGTVSKIDDDETMTVELSKDVKVTVVRSTITKVLNRTEPANSAPANNNKQGSGGKKAAGK